MQIYWLMLCCITWKPSDWKRATPEPAWISGNIVLSDVKDDFLGDFQDDFQHQSFKATAWIECFYVERLNEKVAGKKKFKNQQKVRVELKWESFQIMCEEWIIVKSFIILWSSAGAKCGMIKLFSERSREEHIEQLGYVNC